MANPADTLQGVHFDPDFDPAVLSYVDSDPLFTHFLHVGVSDGTRTDTVKLLGFGSAFSREGGFVSGDVVDPIVNLHEVPQKYQNVGLQGKGVGPRMYNSPQAALGYTELPPRFINAYVFDLDPSSVKDARPEEGSAIARIARHASRIYQSKRKSLEAVVEDIHEGYAGAGAVLMSQPPNALRRQKSRQEHGSTVEVPPEFIIIRGATRLKKVGYRFHPSRPDLGN